MSRETKAQLKQRLEDLKRKLGEAEERAARAKERADPRALETATIQRDAAREAQRKLTEQLEEAKAELAKALERVEALEGKRCHDEPGRSERSHHEVSRLVGQLDDLQVQLEEERDLVDRKQWEMDELKRCRELEVLRAKEGVREEIHAAHAEELRARDKLIHLLKERVAFLEKRSPQRSESPEEDQSTDPTVVSQVIASSGVSRVPGEVKENEEHALGAGPAVARKLTLPTLPRFGGEKQEEDAFERWTRKLLRHAELERWTEREKLLQLELHLVGRAEQLYEVLPDKAKASFSTAVDAPKQRLHPVRSEALLSAQLIKRKQKYSESVDEYAHVFESLFEKSYGKRAGMDQGSKELLKRDLFVQGLAYKWQEKVLPSASSFGDVLHQARLAEGQHKQLNELHSRHSTDKVQPWKPSGKEESSKDGVSETTRPVLPRDTWRCANCGSRRHKTRDCR